MERETMIAVVVAAMISLIFAFSFSILMNNAFTQRIFHFIDIVVRGHEDGGGMIHNSYKAQKSVCDFDITGPDYTCVNNTVGEEIECGLVTESSEDIEFRGPVNITNCDKEKLDSAFDDFSSYDTETQKEYIAMSMRYALYDTMTSMRSSIRDQYSREMFFSFDKISVMHAMIFQIAIQSTNYYGMTVSMNSCTGAYNQTEKARRCLASIVNSFDALSEELKGSVSFGQEWEESCAKNLFDIPGTSTSTLFEEMMLKINSGAMCSRMAKTFRDVKNDVLNRDQNKAEKMHATTALYLLEKFVNKDPDEGIDAGLIIEKIESRLDPEFQEAKEILKRNAKTARGEPIE